MIAEKVSEGGNYFKVGFVKTNKITELQITDARSVEEITFPGKEGKPDVKKIQCEVSYKNQGKEDPTSWTMNNKSRNILIEAWGKNTDDWVMKSIPITIGGSGDMEHVLVDSMRIA